MIDALLFALQLLGAMTLAVILGAALVVALSRGAGLVDDEDPSLDELAHRIRAWGEVTFPTSTPASTAEHLRREVVDEIMRDPTNGEEQADAFCLLVQLARVSGNDLAAEVARKLEINLGRTWKPADSQGVVEHVKEDAA